MAWVPNKLALSVREYLWGQKYVPISQETKIGAREVKGLWWIKHTRNAWNWFRLVSLECYFVRKLNAKKTWLNRLNYVLRSAGLSPRFCKVTLHVLWTSLCKLLWMRKNVRWMLDRLSNPRFKVAMWMWSRVELKVSLQLRRIDKGPRSTSRIRNFCHFELHCYRRKSCIAIFARYTAFWKKKNVWYIRN